MFTSKNDTFRATLILGTKPHFQVAKLAKLIWKHGINGLFVKEEELQQSVNKMEVEQSTVVTCQII